MKKLSEILLADSQRDSVDRGFVQLIRDFVANRGGLKGIAYRTGFSMLEKAKPGVLDRGVQKLLPQFMQSLDPLYAEFQRAGGGDFAAYLQKNAKRAAAALIAVSDGRMENASDTAKKYYAKFRGGAEDEVKDMIPALSKLIARHL